MVPLEENRELVDDLGIVAVALEALEFKPAHPETAELSAIRDRLARSIRSYLIPRVSGGEVPLTVAFAGPTGSGKSTLVNSLSGLDISETGPLRPTTTGPVVLTSERHAQGFDQISGVGCEVVVGRAPILSSVALVDTPDIDSTSVRNRATAEILIDNADIVVFVTSVLRYSDLVPWEVLRRAVSRGAPVIHVLNRITASSLPAVTHFRTLLESQGMRSDIIRVPEHHLDAEIHHVPSIAVRGLQREILSLVSDIDGTRRGIVERVMRSTASEVIALADGLERAVEAIADSGDLTRDLFLMGVEQLDLSSMFDGAVPSDLPDGVLARLGWLWRNRLGDDHWKTLANRATQRLVALVEADLRRLAAGQKRNLPVQSVADARAMARSAAAAWLEEISEVGPAGPVRKKHLSALVLADASVRREKSRAFDLLFDDPTLPSRMRASLEGRLASIYHSTAQLLTEGLDRPLFDGSDAERLRIVASSLTVRSQFADA